jgi:hypothetical protein
VTFFPDLQPIDDFGPRRAKVCIAIGWLDREFPFHIGPTGPPVFRRLRELAKDPFQPFVAGGFHGCNLCQLEPEARDGANLFVPARGFLFVCPAMIIHYINAHHYSPPPPFSEAVLACPDTRSMEYKRLFLENGGRELLHAEEDC